MLVPLLLDLQGGAPVNPVITVPPNQLTPTYTALDIITAAMRTANILAAGETAQPADSQDGLNTFNDLLDSLSTDSNFIYSTVENIFNWTPGKYKYTYGNPLGGTFVGSLFTGSQTLVVASIPSDLIVGSMLVDVQGLIPAGTTVTAITPTGFQMSQPALQNFTNDTIQYSIPGDIPLQRPLRLRQGYTRIPSNQVTTGLDYWFDCTLSMERYNQLGYKGTPGPWPLYVAYQPTSPLGTLWVYPMPQTAGEVHLFTDLVLDQINSVTQKISLPQGYRRALTRLLALELCPSYGKSPAPELMRQASEARAFIKALNASPTPTLNFDDAIVRSQRSDAGWIIHGGFQ